MKARDSHGAIIINNHFLPLNFILPVNQPTLELLTMHECSVDVAMLDVDNQYMRETM